MFIQNYNDVVKKYCTVELNCEIFNYCLGLNRANYKLCFTYCKEC